MYGWACWETSGQRLDNVSQTHLVLAGGKLELQENTAVVVGSKTVGNWKIWPKVEAS